jgi:SAM-dependent methyltransferase
MTDNLLEPPNEDRSSKDYWEWRVKSHADNEQRMIWYGQDYKWDTLNRVANHILSMFENCTALELGCGYGRMCHNFDQDKYLGIDFSEEMIKLAKEKYPEYNFQLADINTFVPDKHYDIIFDIMSPTNSKLEEYADVAFISIKPSTITIKFKELS